MIACETKHKRRDAFPEVLQGYPLAGSVADYDSVPLHDAEGKESEMEAHIAGKAPDLPPQVLPGLTMLEVAHRYAADLDRDIWDFAVEAGTLRSAGLTPTDFRWLVCQGYVLHARETTRPTESARNFRHHGGLTFGRRTCFVVTDAGLAALEQQGTTAKQVGSNGAPQRAVAAPSGEKANCSPADSPAGPTVPHWDSQRHRLSAQGLVIKEFKVHSPNQETVLMAFQEEGWPPRIDDPLPPHREIDPKRRLHDTIKSLNRNQKNNIVRFLGDGTGQAIRWELVDQTA